MVSFLRVSSLATLFFLPLYLWSSGLPQIAHIWGLVWIFFALISTRLSLAGPAKLSIVFAVYATLVNVVLFIRYGDMHTLLSIAYYLYNSFLLAAAIGTAKTGGQRFFRSIEFIFLFWLLLQLLLNALGLGRVFGGVRAMGTFNDPNQFAHWVLWTVILLLAIHFYRTRTFDLRSWAVILAGWLLVALAASRSGLLGMMWVTASSFLYVASSFWTRLLFGSRGRRSSSFTARRVKLSLVLSIVIILVSGSLTLGLGYIQAEDLKNRTRLLFERVEHAIQILEEDGIYVLEERGYDRIWKYPEYILLGAGEGANERWTSKTWFLGEIHSTLAGVLFYYGLPGTFLLIAILISVWRALPNWWLRFLLLAPLFYSIGTYNLRNTMFWIGLAILWSLGNLLQKSNQSFHIKARF